MALLPIGHVIRRLAAVYEASEREWGQPVPSLSKAMMRWKKGGVRRRTTSGLRSGEFLGEAGSGRPTMGDQHTSPDVGLDNLNVANEKLWG